MRYFLLLLVLLFTQVQGAIEIHEFDSPEQEELYKYLVDELRCTVCQNQNLAASNAELAQDMRAKSYKMVKEGKSKDEILQYWVTRYGDFVLYRPPVKQSTMLLWVGPFVFLAFAIVTLLIIIRRRRVAVTEKGDQVDGEKLSQAREMLEKDSK